MIKIGYSKHDITPKKDHGVELFGYYTYSESTRVLSDFHSKLFVQALVLNDGKTEVALVSCDLCEISREIVEKVKDFFVEKRIKVPNIVLAMTHTHSAPATCFGRGLGRINEAYYRQLPEKIAISIVAAQCFADEGVPIRHITSGSVLVDGLNRNRSFENGYIEKELSVLTLNNNVLCNFACHPVTQKRERYEREDGSYNKPSTLVSGDYPGVASNLIENLTGKYMMFFQGADGDMNPVEKYDQTGRTEEMALKFSAGVLEACHNSREFSPNNCKLYFKQFPVKLDLVVPTLEDINRVAEKRCNQKHQGWVKFWEDWSHSMIKKLTSDTPPLNYIEAEVSVLAIGDCVMLFHPAELYSEVGRKIKDASPFEHTWVVSNSNGTVGYVSTDDPKDTRKEYSGEVAPAACDMFPYKSGQGKKLANALIEATKEAKENM